MTDGERDKLLLEMHSTLAAVAAKVEEDHRVLHGNGRKGVIERLSELEAAQKHGGRLWYVIGFLVNLAVAIAALFKRELSTN